MPREEGESPGYTFFMSVRVRFAPSPTGRLHVGNVRTALYNWLFARRQGGTFVLRIEDTDAARSESRFEEQLCCDLRWLGLQWDEGVEVGGEFGPYRQSERYPLYREQARGLLQQGHAYRCFCSPEELERVRAERLAAGHPPGYAGTCRDLDPGEAARRVKQGEPAVLRFRVREGAVSFDDLVFGRLEFDCRQIGDFVLQRSDGSPQYNFAVVVDDLGMRISHVIRGEGHVSNTPRQLLLYEALGEPPPRFAHLSTILGLDGAKLSKRHGSTSLGEFREQGFAPEALVNYLALLGWSPEGEGREILSREELCREFDLSRVHRAPAVFDQTKLTWVNRNHLRDRPAAELLPLVLPALQRRGWVGEDPPGPVSRWLESLIEALRKYLESGEALAQAAEVVFDFRPERDLEQPETREVLESDWAVRTIRAFQKALGGQDRIEVVDFKQAVKTAGKETGVRGRDLYHPIRIALTGRGSGPELDRVVELAESGRGLPLPSPPPGVRQRVERVLALLP